MNKEKTKTHLLKAGKKTTHTGYFSPEIDPAIKIDSGDTVIFDTLMLQDDQLSPNMSLKELEELRKEYKKAKKGGHVLTGPIYINQAEPGDFLEIEMKKITCKPYGVIFNLGSNHKKGTLYEYINKGRLKGLYIDNEKDIIHFTDNISLPLNPFLGCLGLAPPEAKINSSSPGKHGGNIDCKELTVDSKLFLPVFNKGALFSAGDAHATQGDGESCLSAVETAFSEVKLKFTVRKDIQIPFQYPIAETENYWITFGFSKDLDQAVKSALKNMVEFISVKYNLDENDSYLLASASVDLAVTQNVNPIKGIHAKLPKDIFV